MKNIFRRSFFLIFLSLSFTFTISHSVEAGAKKKLAEKLVDKLLENIKKPSRKDLPRNHNQGTMENAKESGIQIDADKGAEIIVEKLTPPPKNWIKELNEDLLENAKESGIEINTGKGEIFAKVANRVNRETLHEMGCKKLGKFVKVKLDYSPIYEDADPLSKVLGKYELNEKICVRYENKGFGLTYFGWTENKNYQ